MNGTEIHVCAPFVPHLNGRLAGKVKRIHEINIEIHERQVVSSVASVVGEEMTCQAGADKSPAVENRFYSR